MKRRGVALVTGFVLVVAAGCGGGGDSSPTTSSRSGSAEPPTVTAPSTSISTPEPVEGLFEIVLDREGEFGRMIPLAGPDDVPIVVYGRLASDGWMVRLARCLDPRCDAVDLIDLPTPPDGWLSAAAVLPDGAPLVGVSREEEASLVVCGDPACDVASEVRIPSANPAALAVAASDLPVLVTSSWPDPTRDEAVLSLVLCNDRRCDAHRSVEVARSAGGHGAVRIGFLPAGEPVVAYERLGPGMVGAEGMNLVACSDAQCRGVTVPDMIEAVASIPPDLPIFAYVHGTTQAVHLVRCLDAACSRAIDVEAYREFEGRTFGQSPVPLAIEGEVVVVLVDAMPSFAELETGASPGLFALRCLDLACGEAMVSEAPLASGAESAGVWLDDGFAVVTRADEPEADGSSRLELTLCRGCGCRAELPMAPVDVSGVDVSGVPLEGDVVFAKEGDIWLIQSGSSEAVNLTETWEFWEGGPAWSPDGTRIAFHSDRGDPTGGNYDIFVMSADGSAVTRITEDAAGEFFPAWSPDGTRLVFSRDNTTDDLRHLVILDVESGTESELTDETRNGDIPRWSPDGTRIVFGRRMPGSCDVGEPCNSNIFVIDADGRNETQLTFADGVHWFPDWSPDGSRIAFHGTPDDPIDRVVWSIYAIDPDGTELVRLTDDHTDQSPTWSPDGSRILFQSNRSGIGHLYTMSADGSTVAVVAGSGGAMHGTDWTW